MNILVTAGNTMTLIDEVRGITNVFSGRTGARIARYAAERGHSVTLLTSNPEVVEPHSGGGEIASDRPRIKPYLTFADLKGSMEDHIVGSRFDAIILCAAVSDYECAGVFAPSSTTRFDPETEHWQSAGPEDPKLVSRQARKVKSDEPELWLRLVPTPKLVDMVREPWGFRGILVKFKLEVGVPDDPLIAIAERSRRHSSADLMVANTWEGRDSWALIGPIDGGYHRIPRPELPTRLIGAIERLHSGVTHLPGTSAALAVAPHPNPPPQGGREPD